MCTLIVETIQLSFVSERKAGFELIIKLFLDHEGSPFTLCAGLHPFVTEVQSDLIHDWPKLPVLVRDEFVPAMACLLSVGILSLSDLKSLNRCFMHASRLNFGLLFIRAGMFTTAHMVIFLSVVTSFATDVGAAGTVVNFI